MSFVKKAVKKVFRFVKKVVKSKIFKWVAIAALVFFTAGVAAGGFAAFTGVNTVGAFFTAVGQTMATGAASIAGSLGFKGASASLAQHGGAAAIQAGLTTTATSATGAALQANAALGTITSTNAAGVTTTLATKSGEAIALSAKGLATADAAITGGGVLTGDAGVVGGIGGTGGGGTAGLVNVGAGNSGLTTVANGLATTGSTTGISGNVWKGIQVGFAAYAASQGSKKRRPKTFVAGGLSRGGPANVGPQPFFVVGGQDNQVASTAEAAPTLAGALSRGDGSQAQPAQAATSGTQIAAVAGAGGNFGPAEVPEQAPVGGLLAPGAEGLAQVSGGGVVQNFLGESAPTNITAGAPPRSFDEQVFSGALGRRRGNV